MIYKYDLFSISRLGNINLLKKITSTVILNPIAKIYEDIDTPKKKKQLIRIKSLA